MKYYSIEELSKLLGVSKPTLYRMRTVGSGPPFTKFGRTVLYSENAVERWLDENTYESTSEFSMGRSCYRSKLLWEYMRANTEPSDSEYLSDKNTDPGWV